MRINRFFNKVTDIVRRVRNAKEALYKYADLMTDGEYRLNTNLTQLYELGSENRAYQEGNYQYDNIDGNRVKTWDLRVKKILTTGTFKLSGPTNKIFQGQILSFTSMQNSIKVFDFKNDKIISVFQDEKFFDEIVRARKYWSTYFNVPSFSVVKGKYNIIEEAILKKVQYNTNDMLSSIVDDYVRYLERVEITEYSNADTNTIKRFSELFEVRQDVLRNYMASPGFRERVVHGDIWYGNVLFDGENRYYIDFENVGKRVFYYDILLFIFIDWQLGNPLLMEQFISGKLDSQFGRLYNSVNVRYDNTKKREMLLTFLYYYYLEYWQDRESIGDNIKELIK